MESTKTNSRICRQNLILTTHPRQLAEARESFSFPPRYTRSSPGPWLLADSASRGLPITQHTGCLASCPQPRLALVGAGNATPKLDSERAKSVVAV